jgi:hypothetical protein
MVPTTAVKSHPWNVLFIYMQREAASLQSQNFIGSIIITTISFNSIYNYSLAKSILASATKPHGNALYTRQ